MNIYRDNWQRYLDLGFKPYPTPRNMKGPVIKWKEEFPPEKVDMAQCQKWAQEFPNYNVWVVIGDKCVIDPDHPDAEVFARSLNLPPCPTSISGGDSIHRWGLAPAGVKALKVTNGGDDTYIEFRTGNMGMLVPPSIHPVTKRPYRWDKGRYRT